MSVPIERIRETLQNLYDKARHEGATRGEWPESITTFYETSGAMSAVEKAAEQLGVKIKTLDDPAEETSAAETPATEAVPPTSG
jgi:hypothetical protein